jgi:hypothetical protein
MKMMLESHLAAFFSYSRENIHEPSGQTMPGRSSNSLWL